MSLFFYRLFIQQKYTEHLHWDSTTEVSDVSLGGLRELMNPVQTHQANKQENGGSSRVFLTVACYFSAPSDKRFGPCSI